MARAAELVKYYPNVDVATKWKEVEPKFLVWLDTIALPVLKEPSFWRWNFRNNWHFSNLCARMQIAIFREDPIEWSWCIDTYRAIFPQALVCSHCKGETTETKRDVTHAMFLLGGMSQVPEMAWHQGVDLYDARLVDCYETHCKIMQRQVPEGLTPKDIKTPYGYYPEPVFETVFAHFHGRKGVPMPTTEAFITSKVLAERVTFHWGAGTLTHA